MTSKKVLALALLGFLVGNVPGMVAAAIIGYFLWNKE